MSPHDFDLTHPVLTRIGENNTEPTFATILVTHVELNTNAASIYLTRGDGVHGHLALTINTVDYKQCSISGVDFQVPAAPSAFPSHKDKATDADIAKDNHQHKALLVEFVSWHNADVIPRNLLITTVPAIFLAVKRNPITGFRNVSCLSLLANLHYVYGCITEKELEQNVQRMRTKWHPPTAITSLFVQLEYGVAFTIEGQEEPTKPTVFRWAYEIISLTGRFEISCRVWLHMDTRTKTWALFKSHFKAADRDLRSQPTSGTAGYHDTPYAAANSATTRKTDLLACLAASKLALDRAMSTASIASTFDTASNMSAITSDPPRVYCWKNGF
jgi:hypothetical protein